ncbi:MAG: BamA/TamA family outer membrane protein [Ignavibacteria bacterium]|nr:BamA/TamA family outer membrane protein [Ignavibacteria bacterium]
MQSLIIKYFLTFLFFISTISFSQTVVNRIEISGNEYFSTSELFDAMVTKKDKIFNPKQFELDLKSIREKYKESGFLLATVKKYEIYYNEDSLAVNIFIEISENKQVKIGKINFIGNRLISQSQIFELIETKQGEILNDNRLNNDIKKLLQYYEKIGLPFTTVRIGEMNIYYISDIPFLEINVLINEGSKVKIDEIKISGNESTKDYVILREVNLTDDKTISREQVEEIKFRLERLNFFEKVEEPQIYTVKNSGRNGLLISVKEGNTNTFDGVIGYVPPAKEDEKGYFTGLVNLSFRNIFGTGRGINAKWQQERKSTQDLQLSYLEPYFLSLPANINFSFNQRIQDTTYTKRNFELKTEIMFSIRFSGIIIAGYERIIPSSDSNAIRLVSDSRILLTGTELKYDSRDNIFNPTKGILYSVSYIYGDKKVFSSTSNNYSVQKYYSTLNVFFSLFKSQVTLLKFFGGQVRTSKFEDSDYFRIGGNKNIRGYREEQFLASRLVYNNLELRYLIGRKSFVFGFFDYGYYFRDPDVTGKIEKQEGFLYGYGFGMQLETALGIIGVSYALGKGDGVLDGKINFGLINNF